MKVLSALAVSKLNKRGFHAVGLIPGVGLMVAKGGSRSWVLRYSVNNRRRHLGLGAFPEVSLADAREAGRKARELIRSGIDPIDAKHEQRRAMLAERHVITFQDAATQWVAAHRSKWRSAKHVAQIESTLRDIAGPVLGRMLVGDIMTTHIMKVLEPRWRDIPDTMSRLQGRIAQVLDWSTVHGFRSGENPARWKGHLEQLLPSPDSISKGGHFASMLYTDVPAFWIKLMAAPGVGAAALCWTILSACRSGETRSLQWQDLDFEAMVWTQPASKTKTNTEHRVPITPAMLVCLPAGLRDPEALAFPGTKGAMSDMTLAAVLRRLDVPFTVHGFRATFRTWAAERTSFPHVVVERCLAHITESEVALAYQRSDYLEQRRDVMQAWAGFVLGAPIQGVVRLAA